MPRIIRRFLAAGVAVVSIFALTACGGGSKGNSGADAKEITLTYSDDQNNAYKTMAQKYTKDTGVKVNIMEVPYADLGTKIANAAKADDLPDVARVPQINPVWSDQLEDLTNIANNHNAMKSLLRKSPDGKILTIASDLTAVGLFLNTSLFDKAGVS